MRASWLFWLLSACAQGAIPNEDLLLSPAGQVGAPDAGTADASPPPNIGMDATAPALPSLDASAAAPDAAGPLPDAGGAAPDAHLDTPDAGAGLAGFAFAPSNLNAAAVDVSAAPAAALDCGATEVDTSEPVRLTNWCGTLPKPSISAQTGGTDLVVLPLAQLQIGAGSSLRVKGTRPLVLLVRGDVTIAGNIDVSASAGAPGPGGDQACGASKGGDGSGDSGDNGAGGAGGGFGTRGGAGGDDSGSESVPGVAGQTRGNAELTPLLAGCGGGRGGGSCAGTPGAGGGALQISASGALVVRGALRADGGDGAEGCGDDAGGTGAGSGGALLLEATSVDVSAGTLSASGGDGGEGQSSGDAGKGAANSTSNGEAGGEGRGSGGGGGGGGFGRIRLRAQGGQCLGC